MSEKSTNLTQELILEDLPRIFSGSSTERWEVHTELVAKANELAKSGGVDTAAIREISTVNAQRLQLDHAQADTVFYVCQKPAGGSLSAMHAPSRGVWQGTGTSITVAGSDVVHYADQPGPAQEWYGPALPYVVDRLGSLVIAHDIAGHFQLNNDGGYQYITNRLRRQGRKGLPHIGSAMVARDEVSSWKPVNPDHPELLTSSSSGTLVEPWVDATYQRYLEYAERAEADEVAGLFDGHPENRRAGLYDTMFSEMVAKALYGGALNHQMLQVFDAQYLEGVDIN